MTSPASGAQHFVPSSWLLDRMIASAEAKFAADRERALRERAERAHKLNGRVIREGREADARRYMYYGDKP